MPSHEGWAQQDTLSKSLGVFEPLSGSLSTLIQKETEGIPSPVGRGARGERKIAKRFEFWKAIPKIGRRMEEPIAEHPAAHPPPFWGSEA
ncbi:MAG: hypothetical protein ACK44E_00760 [Anaerolineales bacterium]